MFGRLRREGQDGKWEIQTRFASLAHYAYNLRTQTYPYSIKGDPMKLTIVLEPQEEGGFTVYVPSLRGCISQGETREEAIENIKEAIELYLEADSGEMAGFQGEAIELSL